MLRLVALPFAFRRPPTTDPERGEKEEPEPTPEPENGSTMIDDNDDEFELADEGELEGEHTADDIIRDMEAEAVEEPVPGPRPRRERTYSSSISLLSHNRPMAPQWYLKLKDIINPKTTAQDLDSYVPNYRYTPILSGIVIPFAILLEIPGLTEHWYIRTENNLIVEVRKNPTILNVGLGFSMACAVLANICLVVRFLEKKVKLMTIGCIVFLTIHDLINITAVTVFGVEHRFNDGFTYGQSFWITVCSTAVSSFTNLTLITDLIRTPDFDNSGSGLTRRQRSLAILVIVLLAYIALGSLIHSLLLELNFIDAMYFSLVSIETIGFGDIRPTSTGARIFTCVYAVFGIVTIALAVGLMRETVLEGLEISYRKRVQAVRQRRKIVRWRKRVSNRWREAVEWRLREDGKPVWVKNKPVSGRSRLNMLLDLFDGILPWATAEQGNQFLYSNHPHGMHLNLEALSWQQLEGAAMEAGVPLNTLLPEGFHEPSEDGEEPPARDPDGRAPDPTTDANFPLTHARLGRMIAMLGTFALAVHRSSHITGDSKVVPRNTPVPQFKKSLTLQYETFRSGMEKEEAKAFYARLVVVWVLFLLFWIVGALIFMKTEAWSFGVSLYFCFIAFTTIGYGDYSPQTPAGRSIFVAWALLGVATMTILISVIAEAFSSKYHTVLHTGVFDQAVKRYRERAHVLATKARKRLTPGTTQTRPLQHHASKEDALREINDRTQTQLEALPHKILTDAKSFHEHMSYFVGQQAGVHAGEEMPPGLQSLLKEITGTEKLGERIKREILQDEDARHTLFTLSIEGKITMITSAESALQALEERERLLNLRESALEEASSSTSTPGPIAIDGLPITTGALTSSPTALEPDPDPSLLSPRARGIKYTRWDTTTSSEYSDWR
ncbi:Tandem pore domain k+ channel [Mycena chlorophos]|uniref:Tandem pore domain k+ channel n=1 Tax=Mycena chlorophos TaxID=658473 RepID=A0A8H6TBU6_MYCCL|nr:Tandem pore domain k+ channel [Mycena chlorophos]